MLRRYLLSVLIGLAAVVVSYGQNSKLIQVKDSLLNVLDTAQVPVHRLEILANLGDVNLSLDNDYSYVSMLWDEAVSLDSKDNEYVRMAGVSMTLRYLNLGQLDSADIWLGRCKEKFSGEDLAYLQLMRDIRDLGDQEKMAQQMIQEYGKFSKETDPYHKMSILYKLAVIALSEGNVNSDLPMKPWYTYMEEGYAIAKTLSLSEGYRFQNQFLMALSYYDYSYVVPLMALEQMRNSTPQMLKRPWHSHRMEIISCSRMLAKGATKSRKELDNWYSRFCDMTSRYPHDCTTPYGFYFYSESIPYYIQTKDYQKVVECCDSAITNGYKYKFEVLSYYKRRGEALEQLGLLDAALDNNKAMMAVKDSMSAASSAAKLMELQTQYDVDKLQMKNRATRQQLTFFIVASSLLLVLLVFIVLYLIVMRRKNRELVEQIRKSEAVEKKSEAISMSIPEERLSSEEQLFRKIKLLFKDPSIFATSKLRREDLAEMLSTNSTYIVEAIRICADMSVSEYVNSLKIKYARQLMESEPSISTDELCDRCGFSSRGRFNSSFKDFYGITPGEFKLAIK